MAGTLSIRVSIVLTAVAAVAFAFLALGGPSSGESRAAKCPKANAGLGEANSEQLADAVLCLVGKERKQESVKKVEPVRSLARVAEKHTDVMVKEDCLAHRCKGEKSLNRRILNSRYPIPGGRYAFGEVTGCAITPKGMVDDWMDEGFHRRQILGKEYRHAGVGVAKGRLRIRRCGNGAQRGVYTVIFGWRKG